MTSSPKVLDITSAPLTVAASQLKLGGTNPQGRSIGFTNYYMMQDGTPVSR